MKTITRRHRLAAAFVAAPLALSLVACGSDSDNAADRGDAGTTTATTPLAPTSEAPGTSSAPTAAAPAPTGDLEAAAVTALASVDGSTLFTIGRNDAGDWEISVVDAGGAESDVDVSADGATITRGPVGNVDGDDGDGDGDDQAERQRLLDVQVDYLAAIEAASASAPNGTVTGVDLDEDNGVATWAVQFDEDTANQITVDVDANSGAVLRTERDD